LHRRRAARAPRREALAAARLRAPAGRGGTEPEAGGEPAGGRRGVSGEFVWRDAGRTVVCRRDALAEAPRLLREHGFAPFAPLGTPRALAGAAELRAAAAAVHEVAPGAVPELAAGLLDALAEAPLVALGGGRAIDTAKAVAAVTGAAVAAVPTT